MQSAAKKILIGATAVVVAASGTLVIAGFAPAAPASVSRVVANTQITRTVSNSNPSVGDEITISTKFQRKSVRENLNSFRDYTSSCLTYVQGSATWENAQIMTVTASDTEVRAEPLTPLEWTVTEGLPGQWGTPRTLAIKYKVTDRCTPGTELPVGNMNYTSAFATTDFSGFAPTITIAASSPPTSTTSPPSTPPSPGAHCYNPNPQGEKLADIIYIGVRGSGQTSGMGEQAWNYYDKSLKPKAISSGRTVTFKEIDYPSAPVSVAVHNFAAYKSSYDTGLQKLKSMVGAIVDGLDNAINNGARCSNAKIVFGGYSQGALVVHRFLQNPTWEWRGLLWQMSGEFGGAILFADPDKFPGDGLQTGSFNSLSSGIAQSVPGTGASKKKLTGDVARNSYSVCMVGDIVCDYTTTKNILRFSQILREFTTPLIAAGVNTHMNAYKVQSSPIYYGVAATRLSNSAVQRSEPR